MANPLIIKNPSIGFLGFGPDAKKLIAQDSKILAPLFSTCQMGPEYKKPCHVLFIYGKIKPDGFIEGTTHHIREVVKNTHAYIVVLASDNNPDIMMRGFPWDKWNHWDANFIFTGNRNGKNFAKFYHHIFKSMFEGKLFGLGWVELSPQGSQPPPRQKTFMATLRRARRKLLKIVNKPVPGALPDVDPPGGILLLRFGNFLFKKKDKAQLKVVQELIDDASFGFMKDWKWHITIAEDALKDVLAIDTPQEPVSLETLLSRLGALAGWGCAAAIHMGLASKRIVIGPEHQKMAILRITDKEGGAYYFGDLINQPVAEAPVCLLSLMGGVMTEVGAVMPDTGAIFRNISKTLGCHGYATIETQIPEMHRPKEQPLETIKKYGHSILTALGKRSEDPLYLGWYLAVGAQKVIRENKDQLEPTLAALIFLEAAIVASKFDPNVIYPPRQAAT